MFSLSSILGNLFHKVLPKIAFWLVISIETLCCLLLIFLILLQKNDDGGIGQAFMRTAILYNRSENLY